jgi:hypothetical protein
VRSGQVRIGTTLQSAQMLTGRFGAASLTRRPITRLPILMRLWRRQAPSVHGHGVGEVCVEPGCTAWK